MPMTTTLTPATPTDDAGDLAGTADYNVFGEVRASSGVSTLFRFTGEQFDAETGFTYLRARYLNPALGRLVSGDSVQPNAPGTQGWNLYAYVANNPTTWIDPTGHTTMESTAIGIAYGAGAGISWRVMIGLALEAVVATWPPFAAYASGLLAGMVAAPVFPITIAAALMATACILYTPCQEWVIERITAIAGLGSPGPSSGPINGPKGGSDSWPKPVEVVPPPPPMSYDDCQDMFQECDREKWNQNKFGPIGECGVCLAFCLVQGYWPDHLCDPDTPLTPDSPFFRGWLEFDLSSRSRSMCMGSQ